MKRALVILSVFALLAGLRAWQTPAPAAEKAPAPPAKADEWKLVFSDEFDKPGLPDPEKWNYEVGYLNKNGEKQYYTVKRPENARVENGKLILEAQRQFRYLQPSQEQEPQSCRVHICQPDIQGEMDLRQDRSQSQAADGPGHVARHLDAGA